MLLETLIPWAGGLAALVVVCRTVLACVNAYYMDQEKTRLVELDKQIQSIKQQVLDEDTILAKIVVMTNRPGLYPYQVGEKVIDELRKNNLITEDRAHHLMLGADTHRGRQ